jgi:hypothetical protein
LEVYSEHELIPWNLYASGWVNMFGTQGRIVWDGEMQGILPFKGSRTPGLISYTEHYPGVAGFTDLTIHKQGGIVFYLGSALWVKIGLKN